MDPHGPIHITTGQKDEAPCAGTAPGSLKSRIVRRALRAANTAKDVVGQRSQGRVSMSCHNLSANTDIFLKNQNGHHKPPPLPMSNGVLVSVHGVSRFGAYSVKQKVTSLIS